MGRESESTMRLSDRAVDGVNCEFEVRFGNQAVSQKNSSPSPTGMAQINLTTQRYRYVMDSVTELGPTTAVQKIKPGVELHITKHKKHYIKHGYV